MSTIPDQAGSTAIHYRVAAGAFITELAASILLSGLSMLSPFIVNDLYTGAGGAALHGGKASFLLYYTIMMVAIVLTMMFLGGQLLARFGARTMLAAGSVVMAAGLAVFALAPAGNPNPVFYLGGAILGVGYGLSLALVPVVVVNTWFHHKRGMVLGIVLAGTGVGGVFWSYATPVLMTSIGWRGTAWLMAVLMLCLVIGPAVLMIRNKPQELGTYPYRLTPLEAARLGEAKVGEGPGLSYRDALRTPWFWLAAAMFALLGFVVAVTQVIGFLLQRFAYAQPGVKASWTPSQIGTYQALFITWTVALIFWKPALGILNDRLGLLLMMLVSFTLMALGLVYLPRMGHYAAGASMVLPVLAMVAMSAGVSNATVTPPLVMGRVVGPREFGRIFSLAVAFYYLGNAVGAPVWAAVGGARNNYDVLLYASPVVLAVVVAGATLAARRGEKLWRPAEAAAQTPREGNA